MEEVDHRKQTGLFTGELRIWKIEILESVRGKKTHKETSASHRILAPSLPPPPPAPPPCFRHGRLLGAVTWPQFSLVRPTAATCQNHVTSPPVAQNRVTVAWGSLDDTYGVVRFLWPSEFRFALRKGGRLSRTTGDNWENWDDEDHWKAASGRSPCSARRR